MLGAGSCGARQRRGRISVIPGGHASRSEEHTSELQSQTNLVCRLLLEKKKKPINNDQMIQYPKNEETINHTQTELFVKILQMNVWQIYEQTIIMLRSHYPVIKKALIHN